MRGILIAVGMGAVGLVGALAGVYIGSDSPAIPEADSQDMSRVNARLDELQTEIARLREEMLRRDTAVAAPMAEAPVEPSALEAAEAVPVAAMRDEDLKAKVLEVVAEKDKAEREARRKRETERAAERETAMMDRLTEELRLTGYQQEELKKIWLARREAFSTLRERMMSGDGGREGIRDEFRKIREESDLKLKEILDAQQYETWSTLNTGRGGGFGGFGGRGGGRGGGR